MSCLALARLALSVAQDAHPTISTPTSYAATTWQPLKK